MAHEHGQAHGLKLADLFSFQPVNMLLWGRFGSASNGLNPVKDGMVLMVFAAVRTAWVDAPAAQSPPSGCLVCPLAGPAAAGPQPGLAAVALLCFGAPLALLLLGAGLTAAFAPEQPGLALLGLVFLPGLGLAGGLGARRRIESWLAPEMGASSNMAQQGISK